MQPNTWAAVAIPLTIGVGSFLHGSYARPAKLAAESGTEKLPMRWFTLPQ